MQLHCVRVDLPRAPKALRASSLALVLTDKAEHGRTDPPDIIAKVEQPSCEGREGHCEVEP